MLLSDERVVKLGSIIACSYYRVASVTSQAYGQAIVTIRNNDEKTDTNSSTVRYSCPSHCEAAYNVDPAMEEFDFISGFHSARDAAG